MACRQMFGRVNRGTLCDSRASGGPMVICVFRADYNVSDTGNESGT